jgi:hypothetical protein
VGIAQNSPISNSHYFNVEVLDDDGKTVDEFRLEISDHVAPSYYKFAAPPEVCYSDMPQSQECVSVQPFYNEHGVKSTRRFVTKPGVTWNNKSDWDAAIRKMDEYVERRRNGSDWP